MANAVLRLPQVKARTGLSRSSIYNYIAQGLFPRELRLGPRSVGWLERELDEWVSDLAASRRLKASDDAIKRISRRADGQANIPHR